MFTNGKQTEFLTHLQDTCWTRVQGKLVLFVKWQDDHLKNFTLGIAVMYVSSGTDGVHMHLATMSTGLLPLYQHILQLCGASILSLLYFHVLQIMFV